MLSSDTQGETRLHMELHAACREESEWWRQKSHCKWIKYGDRNTGFFHKHAESRKNHNYVHEIHASDKVITQFEEIKVEATYHFSDLFMAQPLMEDIDLLNLIPSAVTDNDNGNLKEPVTLTEVKNAVDNMEEDRAPGPDGFNVNFIKIC